MDGSLDRPLGQLQRSCSGPPSCRTRRPGSARWCRRSCRRSRANRTSGTCGLSASSSGCAAVRSHLPAPCTPRLRSRTRPECSQASSPPGCAAPPAWWWLSSPHTEDGGVRRRHLWKCHAPTSSTSGPFARNGTPPVTTGTTDQPRRRPGATRVTYSPQSTPHRSGRAALPVTGPHGVMKARSWSRWVSRERRGDTRRNTPTWRPVVIYLHS
jgi:hypothetical protein